MSLTDYFTPFSDIKFPHISDLSKYFTAADTASRAKSLAPLIPLIPPHTWSIELMPFEGGYVPCYVSPVENAKGVVGLATGMSGSPIGWPEEINNINEQGFSVVSIGLLQTARYDEYYPLNRRLLDTFYLGQKRSPFYNLGDPDTPRYGMPHSTACPMFIDNLSREGALERKPDSLISAMHLNPFLDTYDSSQYYHPFKSAAHNVFMRSCRKTSIGTTGLERWWRGNGDDENLEAIYDRPANKRVRLAVKQVRKMNRQIWLGQRADISEFPQKLYLGTQDTSICVETAKSIAEHIGADVVHFEADHFNVLQNREAINDITKYALATQEHTKQRPERDLRRLGFTLESGTGALDAATSLG